MTNSERAEKIGAEFDMTRQMVRAIESQLDEVVREAVDGLRLPDIMENCEAKGFVAAREKAAQIAETEWDDHFIPKKIREMEPEEK